MFYLFGEQIFIFPMPTARTNTHKTNGKSVWKKSCCSVLATAIPYAVQCVWLSVSSDDDDDERRGVGKMPRKPPLVDEPTTTTALLLRPFLFFPIYHIGQMFQCSCELRWILNLPAEAQMEKRWMWWRRRTGREGIFTLVGKGRNTAIGLPIKMLEGKCVLWSFDFFFVITSSRR